MAQKMAIVMRIFMEFEYPPWGGPKWMMRGSIALTMYRKEK
jgi:hypothetical protein